MLKGVVIRNRVKIKLHLECILIFDWHNTEKRPSTFKSREIKILCEGNFYSLWTYALKMKLQLHTKEKSTKFLLKINLQNGKTTQHVCIALLGRGGYLNNKGSFRC